jgi:hypothetical protein
MASLLCGTALAQVPLLHNSVRKPPDPSILTQPFLIPSPTQPIPSMFAPTPQTSVPTLQTSAPTPQTSASQQPASLTITPSTVPEVLQVLDSTGTWVRLGGINSTAHSFTSLATPGIVYVTQPNIGMRAATSGDVFDNGPLVAAMNAANGGQTTVVFPGALNGQPTSYYFSKTLHWYSDGVLSCQSANYTMPDTLVFAPGIDGVSFDNAYVGPGWGDGTLEGCKIHSLGLGSGTGYDGGNSVTDVNMPNIGVIPATVWEVGDGIVGSSGGNGFVHSRYPNLGSLKHGAYIASVNGSTMTLGTGYTFDYDPNSAFGSPTSPVKWFTTATSAWSVGDTIIHVDHCSPFGANSRIADGAYSPTVFLGKVESCSGTTLTLSNTGTYTGAMVASSGNTDKLIAGVGSAILRLPVELAYHATTQGPINITATGAWSAGATTISVPSGSCTGIITGDMINAASGAPVDYGATVFDYSVNPDAVNATYLGTVKSCSGTTLTFNNALAASAGANDSLTLVSHVVMISGGDGTVLGETDYLWSDALELGYMPGQFFGSPANGGTETMVIEGFDGYAKTYGNGWPGSAPWAGLDPRVKPCPYSTPYPDTCTVASVTHMAGSGKLWKLPSGFHKRVTSDSHNIGINGFFIGYEDVGSGAQGAAGKDMGEYIGQNFIGRLNGGDDIAPNNEYAGMYGGDYFFDILSVETVNGTSWGTNTNSAESGSSGQSLAGGCTYQHTFIGTYSSDYTWWDPTQWSYCMAMSGALTQPPMPGYKTILEGGNGIQDWSPQPGAQNVLATSGVTLNNSYLSTAGAGGAYGFGIAGVTPVISVTSDSPANQAVISGMQNISILYLGLGVKDMSNLNAIPAGTVITDFLSNSQMVLSNNLAQPIQTYDQLEFIGSGGGPCFGFYGPFTGRFGIYMDTGCSSITQTQFTYYGTYWGGLWGFSPGSNHSGPAIAFPGYSFTGISSLGHSLIPQGILMGGDTGALTDQRMIDYSPPNASVGAQTHVTATHSFNTYNTKIIIDGCSYPTTSSQQAVVDVTLSGYPVVGFVTPGYYTCTVWPVLVLNANSSQTSTANIDILTIGGVTLNAADYFTTSNIAIPVSDCTGVVAGTSVVDGSISGSPSIGTVSTCSNASVLALSQRSAVNSSGSTDTLWSGAVLPGSVKLNPNAKAGDFLGVVIEYSPIDGFVHEYPFGEISGDTGGVTWGTGASTDIGDLPTCDATHSVGKIARIWNGIASPTYLQAVSISAVGPSQRRVFCDGTAWLYD